MATGNKFHGILYEFAIWPQNTAPDCMCLSLFGRYAGILSAYGMALADVVYEAQEPCAKVYNPGNTST